jgi:3-deoxy-D-manno-octulosonate 8-phosphate phosphatase (KDO 8-P phosphatase)
VASFPKISPALKKRAAQIELLLMDVDGTMTDGGVTLLSQTEEVPLEIKTFDAHDGQGLTLAHIAGLRTGCNYRTSELGAASARPRNEHGVYLYETGVEDAGLRRNRSQSGCIRFRCRLCGR